MKIIIPVILIITMCAGAGYFVVSRSVNRFRPDVPADVTVKRGMEYTKTGGAPVRLDLYLPEGGGPFPVILWFHSGAWKTLDRSCIEQAVIDQVRRKYVVVSVDYSLSSKAKWPAQPEEAAAAVRWIRSHAGRYSLDPGKVIVWGMSSGAHLAAMLGVTGRPADAPDADPSGGEPSGVKAVVAWCAPVDLSRLPGAASRAAAALLGSRGGIPADAARLVNPVTYVTSDCPPFFIVHGARDAVVPSDQSEELYNALRIAGVRAELRIHHGYGHTDGRFNAEEHRAEIEDFLDSL